MTKRLTLQTLLISITLIAGLSSIWVGRTRGELLDVQASNHLFFPAIQKVGGDWLQLGNDAQRTNSTTIQVDLPYCYTWKWYEVPIAMRAQAVVANGRLFIGDMDGVLHARDANTGAPLWKYASEGPIRHSAGVKGDTVIFSSHDGYTYALNATNGSLKWKIFTGSSSTAPLIHPSRNRAYVASSNGILTALDLSRGSKLWEYDSGAPILTSPAMSTDQGTIFIGNEAIWAIGVDAANGRERWRTRLQGQSLADRYPVVAGDLVFYRSLPLYYFQTLLTEGDEVMDRAGSLASDWAADWAKVRPHIIDYLSEQPSKQSFFALDAKSGSQKGVVPVLYSFGFNDIPNLPVVAEDGVYLTYRARRGIQNDSDTVHVATKYDAELGILSKTSLDIISLRSSQTLKGAPEFRMTSDERSMLSMGGSILWVDHWERLGGLNVKTGQLIEMGAVSNDWPECNFTHCGPGTDNPFFPLSGSGPAYPFPSPRVTEGYQRGGLVIANGMLYWRVIEGGVAGISHQEGSSCPAPKVWTAASSASDNQVVETQPASSASSQRSFEEYVNLDLTSPPNNPPGDLVERLRVEVQAILSAGDHLLPFYLERGFSNSAVWPYNTTNPCSPTPCLPSINIRNRGNVYWHDPGELLYSMALAYPYLTGEMQAKAIEYMAAEMKRYPPMKSLPYGDSQRDWLNDGVPRESYEVPFRRDLNTWPPPGVHISSLYALWLWSQNTGDWSYAQGHWEDVKEVFNARKSSLDYYADLAGVIGYARIAKHFGYTQEYNQAVQVLVGGMNAGLNFNAYQQRAEEQYKDPRGRTTGWSAPVFFGMTPEVGLYIREHIGGQAASYLDSKIKGDGIRWWYLTRAGLQAEVGESAYMAPTTAWSHFLAQAYIQGASQDALRRWLDRPWGKGDLYSIQKIVATIHAKR
jgi:outer membrane protein assembly factor BamB